MFSRPGFLPDRGSCQIGEADRGDPEADTAGPTGPGPWTAVRPITGGDLNGRAERIHVPCTTAPSHGGRPRHLGSTAARRQPRRHGRRRPGRRGQPLEQPHRRGAGQPPGPPRPAHPARGDRLRRRCRSRPAAPSRDRRDRLVREILGRPLPEPAGRADHSTAARELPDPCRRRQPHRDAARGGEPDRRRRQGHPRGHAAGHRLHRGRALLQPRRGGREGSRPGRAAQQRGG